VTGLTTCVRAARAGRRFAAACVLLGVAGGAGCAGGASSGAFPGAQAALPPGPTSTSVAALAWSAARPLAWSDFRGRPDLESPVAAATSYALTWESDCSPEGFRFRVTSVFLPDQSWVKPDVLSRSQENARTLAHEQTHFDLSEVHARRMRRVLSRLVTPCRLTEEQLAAALDPVRREDAARQDRYDRETDHGLDRAQQARWDDEVRRELSDLEQYAGRGVAWSDRSRDRR
jgi:hypothetical protein